MKNFSLNREEQKYFILNYKVENNQIIVYLANHKQYIIPYTLENEKKVLQKMRSQIINSKETEKKLESMVSSCKMLFFYYLCIVLICIVSVPFGAIFSFLGFGLVLTPVIAFFLVWFICKRYSDDLRKNKLFIERGTEMNEFLQTHQNNLSKLSSKAKNIISDCESEEILNLNNMDDITYRDLEFIISQMEFEQHLLFDSASEENSNSFTKSIGSRK